MGEKTFIDISVRLGTFLGPSQGELPFSRHSCASVLLSVLELRITAILSAPLTLRDQACFGDPSNQHSSYELSVDSDKRRSSVGQFAFLQPMGSLLVLDLVLIFVVP